MASSTLPSRGLGSDDTRGSSSGGVGGFPGFSDFVRARQQGLVRAAYLVCGDLSEAEDIVQGALVKLAERWPAVADGHPDAYVRRIIYRDAVSLWRRRRAQRQALTRWAILRADAESRARVTTSDGGHGYAVVRVDLARALGALTAKQRAVVVLRHFEDLSEREVATLLGVSVGTVKSQNHAALETLRRIVPALTGFDGSPAEGTPR